MNSLKYDAILLKYSFTEGDAIPLKYSITESDAKSYKVLVYIKWSMYMLW